MELSKVIIRPWVDGDLRLLMRLLSDPTMMAHLGGPETEAQIRFRHDRYCRSGDPERDAQFAILSGPEGQAVGWIGYWERDWQGQTAFETGWSVLPEFQGQGIAARAGSLLVERVRRAGQHRFLHAFPAVGNAPSNAVCRKAGFTLLGEVDFEYPPGAFMRCNDWRLGLRPPVFVTSE